MSVYLLNLAFGDTELTQDMPVIAETSRTLLHGSVRNQPIFCEHVFTEGRRGKNKEPWIHEGNVRNLHSNGKVQKGEKTTRDTHQ